MKPIRDGYELFSGRQIDANRQVLGLSPERDSYGRLRATEGFDGDLRADGPDYMNDAPTRPDALTPAERREIADYMIALWNEWAAQE